MCKNLARGIPGCWRANDTNVNQKELKSDNTTLKNLKNGVLKI